MQLLTANEADIAFRRRVRTVMAWVPPDASHDGARRAVRPRLLPPPILLRRADVHRGRCRIERRRAGSRTPSSRRPRRAARQREHLRPPVQRRVVRCCHLLGGARAPRRRRCRPARGSTRAAAGRHGCDHGTQRELSVLVGPDQQDLGGADRSAHPSRPAGRDLGGAPTAVHGATRCDAPSLDAGLEIVEERSFTHHCLPFSHNLVYGIGKPLLERGVLPRRLAQEADRHEFANSTGSPWNPIALAVRLAGWFDRLNRPTEDWERSTVNLALRARRPL